MQRDLTLRLLPAEAGDGDVIQLRIASALGLAPARIAGYHLLRRSLDARGKQVHFELTVRAFVDEPPELPADQPFCFRDVHGAQHRVLIVGAGPAGLFAALRLLELGVKPILLERGKDVRSRRRDLALLNREGTVDPDSNYCFGEGGAGAYSDGKLYTRSSKRGDVHRILRLLVHFGADERILYDAHPHIGTNHLPGIIAAMRTRILDCGGQIHFGQRVSDLALGDARIRSVHTATGGIFEGDALVLATGHSARDVFDLLSAKQIRLEFKPFALGVRVEHPQALIDQLLYHRLPRDPLLPPAAYSLVQQVDGTGVFSFCMCPGGIIAAAATAPGEIVVNGWSPSRRNNPYANSGIVVSVDEKNVPMQQGPLSGVAFQRQVEQRAFASAGGRLKAPAQRLADFVEGRASADLPGCSYIPGVAPADLGQVLPPDIHATLRSAFRGFDRKIRGYLTNEAIVVATESRTSSPVRIPRNPRTLAHPQVHNLYPCGEGAGYAGGIVSAAMDGERVAEAFSSLVRI